MRRLGRNFVLGGIGFAVFALNSTHIVRWLSRGRLLMPNSTPTTTPRNDNGNRNHRPGSRNPNLLTQGLAASLEHFKGQKPVEQLEHDHSRIIERIPHNADDRPKSDDSKSKTSNGILVSTENTVVVEQQSTAFSSSETEMKEEEEEPQQKAEILPLPNRTAGWPIVPHATRDALLTRPPPIYWTRRATPTIANGETTETNGMKIIPCRNDGVCPPHTTCQPTIHMKNAESMQSPGICQPWLLVGDSIPLPAARNETAHLSRQQQLYRLVPPSQQASSPRLVNCIAACEDELGLDERMYRTSQMHAVAAQSVVGATAAVLPGACRLTYWREPNQFAPFRLSHKDRKDWQTRKKLEYWLLSRDRFVRRIDPTAKESNDENDANSSNTPTKNATRTTDLWQAYCFPRCDSDDDCNRAPSSNGLHHDDRTPVVYRCVRAACQRNPAYWEETPKTANTDDTKNSNGHYSSLTLVTATKYKYFNATLNLLASLRYWAPDTQAVIYHLGDLEIEQLQILEQQSNVKALHWRNGIPEHYPSAVHHLTGTYGWRSLVVYESLLQYRQILYLDAGSAIAGPLDPAVDALEQHGIFLVHGKHKLYEVHRQTLQFLMGNDNDSMMMQGLNSTQLARQKTISPSVQGHVYPSRYFDTIVRPNAQCALDPACLHVSRDGGDSDIISLSVLAHGNSVPHFTEFWDDELLAKNATKTGNDRFLVPYRGASDFYWQQEQQQQEELETTSTTTTTTTTTTRTLPNHDAAKEYDDDDGWKDQADR